MEQEQEYDVWMHVRVTATSPDAAQDKATTPLENATEPMSVEVDDVIAVEVL